MILTRIPKSYTAEIKLENHVVLMLMISMTNKTLISKHGMTSLMIMTSSRRPLDS